MSNNKGFSLVELIVSMAVFIGLMLIMSVAFDNILSKGGQQLKSAETNTEGIVGLEMLRGDLAHAGFGLPWRYPVTPNPAIDETSAGTGVDGITYSGAGGFEETAAPRAILVQTSTATGTIIAGSATTNPGVGYLVVKSSRVALNDTVHKWAYVNYSGSSQSYVKRWGTSDDLNTGNRVITVSSTFTTAGLPDRPLVMAGAAADPNYYYPIPNTTPTIPPAAYMPSDGSQLFVVYGVDPGADLRMPYNRADYYVKTPGAASMPTSCNPGTGILYKGVVSQADGTFTPYPLLNCVGDMQVEFELDPTNTGNITYTPTLGLTAAEIRSQLKNIRVYILAHEGKIDRNYSYPNNSIQVGDASRPASSGRTLDSTWLSAKFGADWRNYRWKVYTIVVRPKNLN